MPRKPMTYYFDGYYLNADVDDGNHLVWSLTTAGRAELRDIYSSIQPNLLAGSLPVEELFRHLAEDFTASGWEFIREDELEGDGGFPGGLIISDDCDRTDAGDILRFGVDRMWYDVNYQVRPTVARLLDGPVEWPVVPRRFLGR